MDSPPDPKIKTLETWGLGMSGRRNVNSGEMIGPFTFWRTASRKISNKNSVSVGPPQCSGWNWAVKYGLDVWMIPSLVLSLMLTKSSSHSEGSFCPSRAKPWFWAVIYECPVLTLFTGWFWPRLPNGNLYVVAPAANPSNWFPKQIPKIGLTSSPV